MTTPTTAYVLGVQDALEKTKQGIRVDRILPKSESVPVRVAMRCSIVIPAFNRVELTRQCLQNLRETIDSRVTEVIIVDNGSSDGTDAFLRTDGAWVRTISNGENLGFSKACNQGAQAAHGHLLIFLNNDTIPLPGWLDPLIECSDRRTDVGIVGSKLLYENGTVQHAGAIIGRLNRTPHPVYQGVAADSPLVNRTREVRGVTGACMLIRRSLFEKLGGFDEGYRNGFEDIDLCLRVRNHGFRIIYEPTSVLYHLESQTPGRHEQGGHNSRRFKERWWHPRYVDEDWFYYEDGIRSRAFWVENNLCSVFDPIPDAIQRAAWQNPAEVQRVVHSAEELEVDKLRTLLGEPEKWPRDVAVLDWAADICNAYGVPDLVRNFRLHAERLGRAAPPAHGIRCFTQCPDADAWVIQRGIEQAMRNQAVS